MVFVSNMIFDFDLFNLMRKVDGKQLMMGRSVALPNCSEAILLEAVYQY